jgi:hypothetical protein
MVTNLSLVLWIVWAAVVIVTGLLYAYRTALCRDEEGQIFLDDAFAHEKAVQTEIVSKCNRLEPAIRASMIAAVIMTVAVVGYYLWNGYKALFG